MKQWLAGVGNGVKVALVVCIFGGLFTLGVVVGRSDVESKVAAAVELQQLLCEDVGPAKRSGAAR